MRVCPSCGAKNREGLLFCEECGHDMSGDLLNQTISTMNLEQTQNDMIGSMNSFGTAHFRQDAVVLIHIRDATEPLEIQLALRSVLGRADTGSKERPDVDLVPYGALEKGVSRIHAAIERHEETLTLVDLGSSNGTFLNGQRLVPEQPRVLRDGDEIKLGKLIAHCYFK